MKKIFAYGQPVPERIIREISEEYGPENINQEFIETLYYYEFKDNQ